MQKLIKQRLGLIMILATLIVIGLTCYLLLRDNQRQDMLNIRADGTTLTRVLSSIPYKQLAPNYGYGGTLQLLKLYLVNSSLAYVAIIDIDGRLVNKISGDDISLPESNLTTEKSLWLNEQNFKLADTSLEIVEYRAPLLNETELAGYVRTGYYKPQMGIPAQQLSLLAQIALPIFLLMLFFYYLLQRELKPLQRANEKICNIIYEQQSAGINVEASGELKGFIENFNQFMSMTQKQTKVLETVQLEAQTSNNLLSYHKRRVEAALQTLPDAIIIIDESGTTTFANQQIETLTGISIESVIGKKPPDWCENNELITLLSQYHGNLTPLHRIETLRYTPEKYPRRTLSVSVYPLSSPKDAAIVIGMLVIFRDISEQIMASHSRDDFIAHVSHELKSPLNVIAGYTELILEEDQNDRDDFITNMNVIVDEVQRLNILINDLLNITQFESGTISFKRQRIKMQDFLTDTFEAATRPAAEKQITTHIDIARSISTLNIDKDLIRIAINNLLSNAIKYTHEGGKISLEVDEIDDTIQIQITDSGIGISEEEQKHIFEKFYRADNEDVQQQSGHGLGLALTKEIIELHGGEIKVDSKSHEGTTFIVTFMKTSEILREAI